MNTLKVLTPRMAVKRVVCLPLLSKLIHEGITTTIDAVEILKALSAL